MKQLSKLAVSASDAIKQLDHFERALQRAPSFEILAAFTNRLRGIQAEFREVPEVADRAGEVLITAEIKVRTEYDKLPKATGAAAGGKKTGPRGSYLELRGKDAPTIAELGVDKKRLARGALLKAIEPKTRAQYIGELKIDGKMVTPTAVLAKDRAARKKRAKQRIVKAAFSADGPFGTVVIDPPWEVEKIDRVDRPNQAEFDYPPMSPDQLVVFWQRDLVPRIEPDCHLFMWITNKFLPVGFKVIEQIGFRYVLTMVWHKPGGFQPIDLPQYNCEFIIYARKGAPLFIDTRDFFCCFEARRREHSRKPDEFYDAVRRVTGGSRIDVFSREPREGFAQYGDELSKFVKVA